MDMNNKNCGNYVQLLMDSDDEHILSADNPSNIEFNFYTSSADDDVLAAISFPQLETSAALFDDSSNHGKSTATIDTCGTRSITPVSHTSTLNNDQFNMRLQPEFSILYANLDQGITPVNIVPRYGGGIVSNDGTATRTVNDNLKVQYKTFKINNRRRNYTFPKLNLTGEITEVKFNEPGCTADAPSWLRQCFTELLEYGFRNLNFNNISRVIKDSDRVALILKNSNFPDQNINISFRRADQFNVDLILDRLEKVIQSNADFFINENLSLQVDHISMPMGNGKKTRLIGSSFKEFCTRKYGLIDLTNVSDNLCLAYALVLGRAFKDQSIGLFSVLKKNPKMVKTKALSLCNEAQVDLSNGGGLDELKKFQDFFAPDYTIVVYNNRRGKSVLYSGEYSATSKTINILYENNHYCLITSLTAAFSCGYYCERCHYGYFSLHGHRDCIYICPCCFAAPVCVKINAHDEIECRTCMRSFRGAFCFANHLKGVKSVCKKSKKCLICLKIDHSVYNKVKHVCGTSFCKICLEILPISHLCHIPKYTSKHTDRSEILYIFFDLECTQDKSIDDNNLNFIHTPNLCVANNICTECFNNEDIEAPCIKCHTRQHVFEGENCVNDFMAYVVSFKHFNKVIILAHNMSGYDGHFILRNIYTNGSYGMPKVIINGTKITLIELEKKFKFIDSVNYFGTSLANLPKMFNLKSYKGYYPHLFNTAKNYSYIGPIPGIQYFSPDTLSAASRLQFIKWYENQVKNNVLFNNRTELIQYCRLDVDILRKACVTFFNSFWEANHINPYLDAVTIASACNKVYRANYMEGKSIGIIPKNGYRLGDNQSLIALKWLFWVEKKKGINIQHAGTGREVILKEGFKVDGFHEESKTVYEFHGCYYHGCENCYPNVILDLNHDNMILISRRDSTRLKNLKIIQAGYNLIQKSECTWRMEMQQNSEINLFLTNHPALINLPLEPRCAFFGGRTNASKLYHKISGEEKIHYYDICSLYPYINKYYMYPIGHPKVYVGDDCRLKNLDQIEGFIKCRVIAPQNLLYPVLPVRMHGKLLFFLCKACAITSSQIDCRHTENERCFVGTWVVDELRTAITEGYRVLDIYEIWDYPVVRYDVISKTGGLFAGYIDKFLKLKIEASGWPVWCETDIDKDKYIKLLSDHEGISIQKKNVNYNPGLRSLAKQMLNSFWGKFGQRENLSKIEFIDSYESLIKRVTAPNSETEYFVPLSDTSLMLSYKNTFDADEPLNHVSVAIAAFTTAGARLELYKYMKFLGKRLLYYDTDSIIFTQNLCEENPVTGDFLGQMTDELSSYGVGSFITEFVSGGPKNYGFNVYTPSTRKSTKVCKVKGINLNYVSSSIINFDTIKEMVTGNANTLLTISENKILRTTDNSVFSTKRNKRYQICYTKRRRIAGHNTEPFGFKL